MGIMLDGVDSFIYALVLAPAMKEVLPQSGIEAARATWVIAAAFCFPCF
jgi:hypothetical protein